MAKPDGWLSFGKNLKKPASARGFKKKPVCVASCREIECKHGSFQNKCCLIIEAEMLKL